MKLLLHGRGMETMYAAYEELNQELDRAGLGQAFKVEAPQELYDDNAKRGDMGAWVSIAVAALGAGGTLSVLAKVLEAYIASKQIELLYEYEGKKIQLKGKAAEIEAILTRLEQQEH